MRYVSGIVIHVGQTVVKSLEVRLSSPHAVSRAAHVSGSTARIGTLIIFGAAGALTTASPRRAHHTAVQVVSKIQEFAHPHVRGRRRLQKPFNTRDFSILVVELGDAYVTEEVAILLLEHSMTGHKLEGRSD